MLALLRVSDPAAYAQALDFDFGPRGLGSTLFWREPASQRRLARDLPVTCTLLAGALPPAECSCSAYCR